MKQRSFASLRFDANKRPTRRERFLGEMDQVMPWAGLLAVISPSYTTSERRGWPPMLLSAIRRIQFMQQWCSLSDPDMHQTKNAKRPGSLRFIERGLAIEMNQYG